MLKNNSLTQRERTKLMIITSMLAALVFAVTYFIPPIPVPNSVGYVNLGDAVIYCAAMLVGPSWAAAAAAIGSALADWAYGAAFYIPATIIIKGLMGFVCALIIRKANYKRFLLATIIGGAIMACGYFVYEWVFLGWVKAVASSPFNLIQWAGGVLAANVLYYPVKRIKAAI